MKKSLNFARVMMFVSVLALTQAVQATPDTGKITDVALNLSSTVSETGMKIDKAIENLKDLMVGIPIVDVTSIPAHAVIAMEQEFIRMRTEIENEVKNQIKDRMSAKKDNKGNEIDTKLSNVKIPSKEANEAVAEGVVGDGFRRGGRDIGEIEKDAKETTYDITMLQQANWTSSAGSVQAREEYAERRNYLEQEQVIRVLGQISETRKNIAEKLLCGLSGPIKHLRTNYDESDAKKDLDPKAKSAKSSDVALDEYNKVEKTNDYNQVLRQYAFNGLVYDQMLSLEQQILGLRLQAVAGQKAQRMNPLTDKLEVVSQKDEAGVKD